MPTYEYACPTCGIVEAFQSIKEDALTRCPKCKKAKVTRMVSTGGGIIFKGSGFWETDYNRSNEYQQKSKGEKGDAGSGKNEPGNSKKDAEPAKKSADKAAKKASPTTPEPATQAQAKPAPAKPAPDK